jgi:hypothetical protein
MNLTRPPHPGVFVAVLAIAGCVVDRDAGTFAAESTGTSSTGTGAPDDDVGSSDDASTGAAKLDLAGLDLPAEECVSVSQSSSIVEAPSDILVVVDHAASYDAMRSVFSNFSLLIGNDAIEDVRVVMLAGSPADGGGVCIDEPPLGLGMCPEADTNPPMYHHIAEVIAAPTLLEQVLASHGAWGPTMRAGAWKHLWVVSSADASLPTDEFVAGLVALDPDFERLTVHAMVPATPEDGCSVLLPGTEAGDASAYIALAEATGGVFEPLCNFNVGVLFDQMLDRIHEVSLSCAYEIPPPPDGQVFDPGRVNVDYDDGFGLQTIGHVASAADCASVANGWYYDDDAAPTTVLMCPQTCGRFEAADQASIELRFGCATVPAG